MCKIINTVNNDRNKFEEIVKSCNTLNEIVNIYGFADNGKSRDKIKLLITEFNIDISHFGKRNKSKYKKVSKNCPICSKEFITSEGHRDEKYCCSRDCANKFYAKPFSEERKQKISNARKTSRVNDEKCRNVKEQPIVTKCCPTCNISFTCLIYKQKRYCSKKCLNLDPNIREFRKNIMLEKVKNGTHSGWKSRAGKAPSYAEKFFMKVLLLNNISYIRDLNVGGFFIDFAIEDKKIALEIDGKQHLEKDRKERDDRKDICLKSNGWTVVRIPWKSINNQTGKDYMKEQIKNFLELCNNTLVLT
jgi:very-short-patch-repair endonuclease